jgi:hypothetical protein
MMVFGFAGIQSSCDFASQARRGFVFKMSACWRDFALPSSSFSLNLLWDMREFVILNGSQVEIIKA